MQTRARDLTFLILAGFFITNAIVAEIIGGKLFAVPAIDLGFFQFPSVVLSIGVILWPVVFITTDLVNEYYGKPAVRRLTFLTVGMICFTFIILFIARAVPTFEIKTETGELIGVTHDAFSRVAGQSMWIIVGSIAAFVVSQFVDVSVFWFFRHKTEGRMLWLRATGSTAVSQIVDTVIVQFIGLYLAGVLPWEAFVRGAMLSYVYKLLIAIAATPVIYAIHAALDRWLHLHLEDAKEKE